MITLADIAQISGLPEEQVVKVAGVVKAMWMERVATWVASPSVQTMDFIEATAVLSVLRRARTSPLTTVLEVGTQFGISTWIFDEGMRRVGVQPRVVTYDVERQRHVFDSSTIEFRQEDITERCEAVLDELRPQAVFLDAHPWPITYNMTLAARRRGVLLCMHDVSDSLWVHTLQEGRLPLAGNEYTVGVTWERKVLETVFGAGIHTGRHETDDYRIDLVRSLHGVAICQPRLL